jgi:hypothetical protein
VYLTQEKREEEGSRDHRIEKIDQRTKRANEKKNGINESETPRSFSKSNLKKIKTKIAKPIK